MHAEPIAKCYQNKIICSSYLSNKIIYIYIYIIIMCIFVHTASPHPLVAHGIHGN